MHFICLFCKVLRKRFSKTRQIFVCYFLATSLAPLFLTHLDGKYTGKHEKFKFQFSCQKRSELIALWYFLTLGSKKQRNYSLLKPKKLLFPHFDFPGLRPTQMLPRQVKNYVEGKDLLAGNRQVECR